MNINLSKWMERIDDKTDILSLDIPGAHDCAANFIPFEHFSKCQNTDVYGLLSLGIRVLDLRVKIKNNSLVTAHAFCARVGNDRNSKIQDISDIIKHIKRFLEENPSETVLLQFKNDSESKMKDSFDILANRYLQKENNLWFIENRIPSLGEVRGKIVLLRRCDIYDRNKAYNTDNSGIDLSGWANQYRLVPSPTSLETHSKKNDIFIIQDRYNYLPHSKWKKCVKPFLDERKEFDGKYIINHFSTSGGLGGPKTNADYINTKFLKYSLKKDNYYGILFFDFPTKEITKKIIENNFD